MAQLQQIAAVEFTTLLAQAGLAMLVGVVLVKLYREYRDAYVERWAYSWIALGVFQLLASAGRFLAGTGGSQGLRLAVAAVALAAGYLQVGWLVLGAWELRGRRVPPPVARFVVASCVLVGVGVVLATSGAPIEARLLGRYGIRALAAGAAFVAAGVAFVRVNWVPAERGRLLVAGSLIVLGAFQALQFLLIAHVFDGGAFGPYLGIVELVLVGATGIAIVVGLLEEERDRGTRAARELEHLAYHDPLTGLPNRRLFVERVVMATARAPLAGRGAAVLLLNLRRFRAVNESLGHAAGDEALRTLAQRVREAGRPGATVARLSGDEFGVLLSSVRDADDVAAVAHRLLAAADGPIDVGGQPVYLSACVGASQFPGDGLDASSLLRAADVALAAARQEAGNAFRAYAAPLDRHVAELRALEADLRRALRQGELDVVFQPVVELAGRRLSRLEALVRWRHPGRGLLAPGVFLPAAERAGLDGGIDLGVRRRVCEHLRAWRDAGLGMVHASVNVGARGLQEAGFVESVVNVARDVGIEPDQLEIEITETTAMLDPDATRQVIRSLQEHGVRVAIDDFGTGYSSLSYLRSLPVDCLKIDRSFVKDLPGSSEAGAIVAAIITLAHSLRLVVVAEGVEREEQLRVLEELSCDQAQGFLLGAPGAPDSFEPLLRRRALTGRPTPPGSAALTAT